MGADGADLSKPSQPTPLPYPPSFQEKKLVRDLEALTSTRLELNRNLTVSKNEAPGCRKVTQDKDKGGHLKCVPDYPPVSCWGWPVSSLLDPQSFLTYSYTSAEMVVSFGIIGESGMLETPPLAARRSRPAAPPQC